MMSNNLEHRYFAQEFRVSKEGEAPRITGYAAVFDSNSEDMGWTEQIDNHAFDSVMATNPDVRALFNHNPDAVLGRTTAGTLSLTIDARGLAYSIDPPNTQLANDLMVSMRRGDITGSSFGFITKRDQWTENSDGSISRRILEFDQLFDISPVTYPAFTATSTAVRSLPDTMPAELRSRFNNEKKSTRAFGLGCSCSCAQCAADACGICSNDDCNDPDCACYRSKPLPESERRKMEMRLALLALK
jgi:hypothetical protein